MTRIFKTATALLMGCAMALSCDEYDIAGFVMSTSDNVDRRFATSMEYNEKHGYQTIRHDSDEYELYVFSDCHLKQEVGTNLKTFTAEYVNACGNAPAVLFLGDIVNGKDGWDQFIENTQPLRQYGHLFITAGNHDLYFGQWPEYVQRFGTSTYWFEIVCPTVKDLYISLDSGSGTLGTDQRVWVETILKEKASQYRHVIVFTHTHFFKVDNRQGHTSNYSMEETYDLLNLFSQYGVELVLTGHKHFYEQQNFKGVEYVTVDGLSDDENQSGYIVCKIKNDISIKSLKVSH